MEAKDSKFGNLIYTILTSLIVLLGKFRSHFCITNKTAALRFDRTTPYADYGHKNTFMGCCDCGLAHFIIPGHSVTPERTKNYNYKYRMGSKAWHEPENNLVGKVIEEGQYSKVIE